MRETVLLGGDGAIGQANFFRNGDKHYPCLGEGEQQHSRKQFLIPSCVSSGRVYTLRLCFLGSHRLRLLGSDSGDSFLFLSVHHTANTL
jgi:hypothetical protein